MENVKRRKEKEKSLALKDQEKKEGERWKTKK